MDIIVEATQGTTNRLRFPVQPPPQALDERDQAF